MNKSLYLVLRYIPNDEIIDMLEKSTPRISHMYLDAWGHEQRGCPRCFEKNNRNEILYAGQKFCSVCGQAILKRY